ncbi:MAG: 30S ribosomal protein S20 [bacterium]|jgi:small subunit ribosomal protein S20
MPNIESARKRVRQSAKRNKRNRSAKSMVSSGRKALLDAIESGNKGEALKLFAAYASELDKSVKNGILKFNNASRKKSRIQLRLNALA